MHSKQLTTHTEANAMTHRPRKRCIERRRERANTTTHIHCNHEDATIWQMTTSPRLQSAATPTHRKHQYLTLRRTIARHCTQTLLSSGSYHHSRKMHDSHEFQKELAAELHQQKLKQSCQRNTPLRQHNCRYTIIPRHCHSMPSTR